MKAASFEYHRPATIGDAVSCLEVYSDEDSRILAGGQSLVPMMALRIAQPRHLIDINGIPGLDQIFEEIGFLRIPACVRHHSFHQAGDGLLSSLLREVSHHIAHAPIRARGTFCGSIAHSDPASEWCMVATTLGAEIVTRSCSGERLIPASVFFQGVMTTALEANEMVTEVKIPLLSELSRYGFYEFARRSGDFAMATALVVYNLLEGRMIDVRVGIGGVEGYPRRVAEAEEALEGEFPSPSIFANCGAIVAANINPLRDPRISADYRRDLVKTVVQRALEKSVQ